MFDLTMIEEVYKRIVRSVDEIRGVLNKPLTLTEKIMYSHLYDNTLNEIYIRGESYPETT